MIFLSHYLDHHRWGRERKRGGGGEAGEEGGRLILFLIIRFYTCSGALHANLSIIPLSLSPSVKFVWRFVMQFLCTKTHVYDRDFNPD